MWGQRANVATGDNAEGDKLFLYGLYSGALTTLAIGMPLFVDFTDAAEHNKGALIAATALSPAVVRSGGKFFNGATANANLYAGVWQPESAAFTNTTGGANPVQNVDILRMQILGRAVVQADGGGGAGTSVKVGDILRVLGTQANSKNNAVSDGPTTYTAGLNIGVALATGTLVAFSNVIIASGATVLQINAFLRWN